MKPANTVAQSKNHEVWTGKGMLWSSWLLLRTSGEAITGVMECQAAENKG